MSKKNCSKCKKLLPANTDYFHRKKDGLTSHCKVCEGVRYTRFLELKEGEMYCKKCNKTLPYTEEYFPKDKSAKDGLRKTCLICSGRSKYGKRRKLNLRELKEGEQRNRKPSIEEVKEFCRNIGGECLEDKYINGRAKMSFKCSECESSYEKTFIQYKQDNHSRCVPCNRKHSTEINREKYREDYLNEVKEICNEIGLKLLSERFDHPHADLEFECSICKSPFKRRYHVLKDSMVNYCNSCSRKKVAEARSYTIEEVEKIFEEEGCLLLSEEYTNNKQNLEYICNCGRRDKKALANFMNGQRCKICGIKKNADNKRTPYEEVKKIFEDAGCELLSKEFIHSNHPLEYLCTCGKVTTTVLGRFKGSVYKKCFQCASELSGAAMSGENHPFWNPNLTDKDREDRRLSNKNKEWRYAVYERDGFQCVICGGGAGSLNAHHKDGYNWCKERRHDLSNGVTLCYLCHSTFHIIYGYGDNTEEQYNRYVIDYKNGELDEILKERRLDLCE